MRFALLLQSNKSIVDDLKAAPIHLIVSILGITLFLFRIETVGGFGIYIGLLGVYWFAKKDKVNEK
jgi:hypothetical protein